MLANTETFPGRSHAIDALRGFFACWVLLAHSVPWTEQFVGGVPTPLTSFFIFVGHLFQGNGEMHPAVLGFIVLSGYCIHRNGLRHDHSQLGAFAIRRCFRILPTYLAASLFGLTMLVAGFSIYGTTHEFGAGCVMGKYLFVSVLTPFFYHCAFNDNGPLGTVTDEILLYVVYAFFFAFFVWKKRERWIWSICALSLVSLFISAALATLYPDQYTWLQTAGLYGFLPYWWLGVAFLDPSFHRLMQRGLPFMIGAWIILTLFVLWMPNPLVDEFRKVAFACCLGNFICWLELFPMRANHFGAIIGRSSYSIYAFHGPLAGFLVLIGSPLWLTVAACIGFGMLTYQAIERPCIKIGRDWSRRALLPVAET